MHGIPDYLTENGLTIGGRNRELSEKDKSFANLSSKLPYQPFPTGQYRGVTKVLHWPYLEIRKSFLVYSIHKQSVSCKRMKCTIFQGLSESIFRFG
jgi:hypothetical protein